MVVDLTGVTQMRQFSYPASNYANDLITKRLDSLVLQTMK